MGATRSIPEENMATIRKPPYLRRSGESQRAMARDNTTTPSSAVSVMKRRALGGSAGVVRLIP